MQESLTNHTITPTPISLTKASPTDKPKSMRGTNTLFFRTHWASHVKMNEDIHIILPQGVVGNNNSVYHTPVFEAQKDLLRGIGCSRNRQRS